MTRAEKLITIAENQQKVYNAGHANGYSSGYTAGSDRGYLEGYQNCAEKINPMLDNILAIQEELLGVTFITFTIEGVLYIAEEGMTWRDLCDSEYNTKNFRVIGADENGLGYEYISSDNGAISRTEGTPDVGPDELIIGSYIFT